MADGIPPWLDIDPLKPVQFFLQGTSTGVGAAEARNRAQAAAMELAQRAAAQQAANERAALAAQADAAQTAARIQEIQQQQELNQQRAAVMAKQYAASNNIRDAIARGVDPALAAFQNPDFFLPSPAAFSSMMRERETFQPEIIDIGPGVRGVRTSRGQIQILPPGATTGPIQTENIVNQAGEVVGQGFRGPSGAVQQVATERAGALSQEQIRKLDYWEDQEARASKKMDKIELNTAKPEDLVNDKEYQSAVKTLEKAGRERRKILGMPEIEEPTKEERPSGRYGVFDVKTGKVVYRDVAPPATTPAPAAVATPAPTAGTARQPITGAEVIGAAKTLLTPPQAVRNWWNQGLGSLFRPEEYPVPPPPPETFGYEPR